MPSYRRTLPRIEWGARETLFRYVAGDDLTLAGAVFARTGEARYVDANGVLQVAASGVARDGHYVNGERTLLLEPASTNLVVRSQELNTWSASFQITVTPNALVAPDGTLTADLMENAGPAGSHNVNTPLTLTDDGTKALSVYLRAGSAAATEVAIHDSSAGVTRHRVRATWASGVPTVTSIDGAGVVFEPVFVGNGWWRIEFCADSCVAANANAFLIYPTTTTAGATGTVYGWGAQAENAAVPSSYIPTAGSAVTRNADSLYFPFTAPPQAMTVCVRGVELSNPSAAEANARVLACFGDNLGDPVALLYRQGTVAGYRFAHDPATLTTTSDVGTSVARGSVVELRGVLGADGSCLVGVTDDGGAEITDGPSTAQPLGSAWNVPRLYVGSAAGSVHALFAVTHVVVAAGEKTMARMRAVGSGDDLFATVLTSAYPLDEAVSFGVPQEGSQMVFVPSGEADGWEAGEAHVLDGVLRWIPREDTVTPAATGWDGDAGVRAFLAWARRGNPFWFCPDASDLSTGWTVHLESPFDEAPTLEADMTRALRVRLRAVVPIEGY